MIYSYLRTLQSSRSCIYMSAGIDLKCLCQLFFLRSFCRRKWSLRMILQMKKTKKKNLFFFFSEQKSTWKSCICFTDYHLTEVFLITPIYKGKKKKTFICIHCIMRINLISRGFSFQRRTKDLKKNLWNICEFCTLDTKKKKWLK